MIPVIIQPDITPDTRTIITRIRTIIRPTIVAPWYVPACATVTLTVRDTTPGLFTATGTNLRRTLLDASVPSPFWRVRRCAQIFGLCLDKRSRQMSAPNACHSDTRKTQARFSSNHIAAVRCGFRSVGWRMCRRVLRESKCESHASGTVQYLLRAGLLPVLSVGRLLRRRVLLRSLSGKISLRQRSRCIERRRHAHGQVTAVLPLRCNANIQRLSIVDMNRETTNSTLVRASRFFSNRYAYRAQAGYLSEFVAFGVIVFIAIWPVILLVNAMSAGPR
jgi:hypothetical protein